MKAEFMPDALEQALHARRNIDGLIHHSDRGTQGGLQQSSYLGMRPIRLVVRSGRYLSFAEREN